MERLAFEMHNEEYWSDIDSAMQVFELINGSGYQQFVFDENGEKLSFGIPLKTVEDLIRLYTTLTGCQLKYWQGDLPINALWYCRMCLEKNSLFKINELVLYVFNCC